jgi:hypothetical protein
VLEYADILAALPVTCAEVLAAYSNSATNLRANVSPSSRANAFLYLLATKVKAAAKDPATVANKTMETNASINVNPDNFFLFIDLPSPRAIFHKNNIKGLALIGASYKAWNPPLHRIIDLIITTRTRAQNP